MAHITGGGLPGNLNRRCRQLDAVVETASWRIPNLFPQLERAGGVDRPNVPHVQHGRRHGRDHRRCIAEVMAAAAAQRPRRASRQDSAGYCNPTQLESSTYEETPDGSRRRCRALSKRLVGAGLVATGMSVRQHHRRLSVQDAASRRMICTSSCHLLACLAGGNATIGQGSWPSLGRYSRQRVQRPASDVAKFAPRTGGATPRRPCRPGQVVGLPTATPRSASSREFWRWRTSVAWTPS